VLTLQLILQGQEVAGAVVSFSHASAKSSHLFFLAWAIHVCKLWQESGSDFRKRFTEKILKIYCT
jgi:hypothetical protein